jgi:transcriptional regulator with XRE-family HTH domain
MMKSLLEKLAQADQAQAGEIAVPAPETVGFVIRWERALRGWKQSTLADFGQVSVSTIERTERGEKISDDSLERIGQAFGYGPGRFTAPRRVKTQEEAYATLVTSWAHLEPVDVRPLRTQMQVRMLARCHAYLFHRPGVGEAYDDDIAILGEWLDLASYIINWPPGNMAEGRRRKLYRDILDYVQQLERRAVTVLCGTMAAPQSDVPDWRVAVVTITPKLSDPGALKRRTVLVDRRCCTVPEWPAADASEDASPSAVS